MPRRRLREPQPIEIVAAATIGLVIDASRQIADALGETPDEKKLYKQIFDATKASFEKEAAAKGWKKVADNADVHVMLHGATQTKRNANTFYSGTGGGYLRKMD